MPNQSADSIVSTRKLPMAFVSTLVIRLIAYYLRRPLIENLGLKNDPGD